MRIVTSENRKSASVSFRVANTTSLAHNNRENTHGNPDIEPLRMKDNVTYVRESIEDIYKREFNDAVAEYNSKQKRSDRRIDDYYKKILNDSKTHHQREIVVAIGKKDDGIDWEYKKNILDEYARNFQKDNPNLIVYNSVLHMDEANPHLHINYVPVYEANRGLKKRIGHDKSIQQQGYDDFNEWQSEQRETLEDLMNGYRLERQYVGTHKYLPVAEYKDLKDEVKELEKTKASLNVEVDKRTQKLNKLPNLKAINVEVEARPNRFNSNEVVVEKKDFEKIKKFAKLAKAQSEKSSYYQEQTREQQQKSDVLKTQNKSLVMENFELENRIDIAEKKAKKWEQKFNNLLGFIKEFANNVFEYMQDIPSEIYYSFKSKMNDIEQDNEKQLTETKYRNKSRDNGLER